MKKSSITTFGSYFDRYIDLADDIDLIEALEQSLMDIDALDMIHLRKLGNWAYAEGKWSVKDIIQHIIDTERIFCFRTLCIVRQDPNIPQGYDEDEYASNARANKREIDDIIDELKVVRQSTIAMFKSFDDEDLNTIGTCWKYPMSVLAMGFILVGHQRHHFAVMKERYAGDW
jgi:DinB superfamily